MPSDPNLDVSSAKDPKDAATSDSEPEESDIDDEKYKYFVLIKDPHTTKPDILDKLEKTGDFKLDDEPWKGEDPEKSFVGLFGGKSLKFILERRKARAVYLQYEFKAVPPGNPPQKEAPWGLARLTSDCTIDTSSSNIEYIYDADACGQGVDIYIVEMDPIRTSHREFENLQRPGHQRVELYDRDKDERGITNSHAMMVAGIAAGNTYGVAKRATIVPVCLGSSSNFSQDVEKILAKKSNSGRPAVVNISSDQWLLFAGEMVKLIRGGVHVVFTAGNNDKLLPEWQKFKVVPLKDMPYLKTAICVGASCRDDTKWGGSNYGPMVDLFAPGHDIESVTHDSHSSYETAQGTSFAAPHVAGIIACLLSHANYKNLEPRDMKAKILAMAWEQGVGEFTTSGVDWKTSTQNSVQSDMVQAVESMKSNIQDLNKRDIARLDKVKEKILEATQQKGTNSIGELKKKILEVTQQKGMNGLDELKERILKVTQQEGTNEGMKEKIREAAEQYVDDRMLAIKEYIASKAKERLLSYMERMIAKNMEDRVRTSPGMFKDRQEYLKQELDKMKTYIQDVAKPDLLNEIDTMIQQLGNATKDRMRDDLGGMKQKVDNMTYNDFLLDPERMKTRVMMMTKSKLQDSLNSLRTEYVWKLAEESLSPFNTAVESTLDRIQAMTWAKNRIIEVNNMIEDLKTKLKDEIKLDIDVTTTRRLASCRLDRWGRGPA